MKRIILLSLLTFSYFIGQSQGIQRWFEDFEVETNGAVTSATVGTPKGTWFHIVNTFRRATSFSRQTYFFNRFAIK